MFSAYSFTSTLPQQALRDIEYWCGNPSIELVNGLINYYHPFPAKSFNEHLSAYSCHYSDRCTSEVVGTDAQVPPTPQQPQLSPVSLTLSKLEGITEGPCGTSQSADTAQIDEAADETTIPPSPALKHVDRTTGAYANQQTTAVAIPNSLPEVSEDCRGSIPLGVLIATRIPNHMSPAEFCEFFSPHDQRLLLLKVLHGPYVAHYIMLLLCPLSIVSPLIATFHNKLYNTLEPTECELYLVHSLSIVSNVNDDGIEDKETEGNEASVFDDRTSTSPASFEEAKSSDKRLLGEAVSPAKSADRSMLLPQSTQSTEGSKYVFKDPIELFTRYEFHQHCAICLEKLCLTLPTVINNTDVLFYGNVEAAESCTTNAPISHNLNATNASSKDTARSLMTNSFMLTRPYYDASMITTSLVTGTADAAAGTGITDLMDSPSHYSVGSAVGKGTSMTVLSLQPSNEDSIGSNGFFFSDKKNSVYASPAAIEAPQMSGMMIPSVHPNASGVPINVLCGHSFHSICLRRWSDISCPVCRFQQYPFETVCCDVCGRVNGLRMCLVCGFIGCYSINYIREETDYESKQQQGLVKEAEESTLFAKTYIDSLHSLQHFKDTNHTYALEIYTRRVWDYTREGYVHRLIQNRLDGKIVEVAHPYLEVHVNDGHMPSNTPPIDYLSLMSSDKEFHSVEKKLEQYISEFNSILASQLDSQREYYDKRLEEFKLMYASPTQECLNLLNYEAGKVIELENAVKETADSVKAQCAELEGLKQEEEMLVKHRNELETLRSEIASQHQQMRQLKQAQEEDQQSTYADKVATIADLQQQIYEMKTHLMLTQRLTSDNQTREGSFVIGEQREPFNRSTGRRRKHRHSKK